MASDDRSTRDERFTPAEMGAIAHLYRGEMYRSKIWRTRLDASTNWAVVTTGIALSVVFSNADSSGLPIILVSLLVGIFLLFEARRYRFFDIWRTRVRVMELHFYGPILRGEGLCTDNRWNEILADDYRGLYFHISFREAIGRRLRRNYSWIFAIQLMSFLGKVSVHPTPLESWEQLWTRTAIGPLPGQVVLAIGAVFYLGLLALGIMTLGEQRAVGRARSRPREDDPMRALAEDE